MKIQISTTAIILALTSCTFGFPRLMGRDGGCGDLKHCHLVFCCDDKGTIG
jgi:hypothetical protein